MLCNAMLCKSFPAGPGRPERGCGGCSSVLAGSRSGEPNRTEPELIKSITRSTQPRPNWQKPQPGDLLVELADTVTKHTSSREGCPARVCTWPCGYSCISRRAPRSLRLCRSSPLRELSHGGSDSSADRQPAQFPQCSSVDAPCGAPMSDVMLPVPGCPAPEVVT